MTSKVGIGIAVVVLLTVSVGVTAAEPSMDDFLSESDFLSEVFSVVNGLLERLSNSFDTESWSPSEKADSVQAFYNERSVEFERYVNDRTDASSSANVVRLSFLSDEENATVYLVSDVNGSSYENSSVVDSTGREVDQWVTLCGPAAKNAPEELEAFYESFVSEDANVTTSYVQNLGAEYVGKITSSFIGNSEVCDG